jgi:molybdopterin-guanine dinucleotide biosynthesis protein A
MNIPNSFSAVLLAGGQSQRMGTDKALVEIEGEPLWARQIEKLRNTGAQEILISGRANGPYSSAGMPIVEDLTPDAGPLAGIEAALRHAGHHWLLVLAIDLPDISAEFLQKLVAQAMGKGIGLVPAREEWLQPTAAVYSKDCLPLVGECLAGENRSLRRFFRLARKRGLAEVCEVSAAEHAQFRNLNTPEDLTPPPASSRFRHRELRLDNGATGAVAARRAPVRLRR